MNFFNPSCQEPSRNDIEFGLCDDQNGGRAYTNTTDPTKWVAIVKNNRPVELVFTAIDKCVIQDNEYPGRGRCDGLLTSTDHIYFVELKDAEPPWRTKAKEQLESTVQFFIENHDISLYKHKKAYACNKKYPEFAATDNEENLQFFRNYGVRLDLHAEILIL